MPDENKNNSLWLKGSDKWDSLGGGLRKEDDDYLQTLAKQVARPGMVGFDTGCFTGSTASYVWPVFKENGGRFYCVDWFRGNIDTVVGGYWWGSYPAEAVLIQLLKNIEVAGALDYVSVIVAESWMPAEIVADKSVDYVYIGGDHRYSCVKRDILAWLPKLRPGGILCGHAFQSDLDENSVAWKDLLEQPEHDWNPTIQSHFGVVRACHELLAGYERGGVEIWSYRKPA